MLVKSIREFYSKLQMVREGVEVVLPTIVSGMVFTGVRLNGGYTITTPHGSELPFCINDGGVMQDVLNPLFDLAGLE